MTIDGRGTDPGCYRAAEITWGNEPGAESDESITDMERECLGPW